MIVLLMILMLILNLMLSWASVLIGTLGNKDGDADTYCKEQYNSKYNNCTLECIELGKCTVLSLKLEREKIFLEFSGQQGRNNR